MPPSTFEMPTYAMQIAELDGAAQRLGALSGSVRAEGLRVGNCVRVLSTAAAGSALALRLPGVGLGHVADQMADRCRASAERTGVAAEAYRAMEAALQGVFEPAGGAGVVPR
ncbi:MAG: hypothetical protein H0T85_09230 [Geodermatophilaceae bacterium]|nr:hypothetical protein [Geodermatophilaceae bacterium]